MITLNHIQLDIIPIQRFEKWNTVLFATNLKTALSGDDTLRWYKSTSTQ